VSLCVCLFVCPQNNCKNCRAEIDATQYEYAKTWNWAGRWQCRWLMVAFGISVFRHSEHGCPAIWVLGQKIWDTTFGVRMMSRISDVGPNYLFCRARVAIIEVNGRAVQQVPQGYEALFLLTYCFPWNVTSVENSMIVTLRVISLMCKIQFCNDLLKC